MATIKIKEGIYAVGVINPNLRVFDIVMTTEYGTSYNSYVVKGSEKTALFETVHDEFFDEYLENLKQSGVDKIDYIVCNHTEPDHSGSLKKLIAVYPNAKIISSAAGKLYLKNIINDDSVEVTVVKDNEELSLGDKTVVFKSAPFLHWPDSMFSYIKEDNVLITCDFLGCHYCEPRCFDKYIRDIDAYNRAFDYYYAGIFGPFPEHVKKGLNIVKSINPDYVLPSHGPVLTKDNIEKAIERYDELSTLKKSEKLLIPIFYASAYGCTEKLACSIADGIKNELPNADVRTYDLVNEDIAELSGILNLSDGFLIGSPTINKDAVPPIWNLLSHVNAIGIAKRPAGVFGSYGWSGEAIPNMENRLKDLKCNVAAAYKVQFVPSEEQIKGAFEYGVEFANQFK